MQDRFFHSGWSLDACVGRALADGLFTRSQIVSTRTLYSYVSQGQLRIRQLDLPEQPERKKHSHPQRCRRRILGRGIEERDSKIALRGEFGHWECDLVLGHKTRNDTPLLTLCERKTRLFLIRRIEDETAGSVMRAFTRLQQQYGNRWDVLFKTITTDNGSEFADFSKLEQSSRTRVYYARPYASCDKGRGGEA